MAIILAIVTEELRKVVISSLLLGVVRFNSLGFQLKNLLLFRNLKCQGDLLD